jgi:hypothetical protein
LLEEHARACVMPLSQPALCLLRHRSCLHSCQLVTSATTRDWLTWQSGVDMNAPLRQSMRTAIGAVEADVSPFTDGPSCNNSFQMTLRALCHHACYNLITPSYPWSPPLWTYTPAGILTLPRLGAYLIALTPPALNSLECTPVDILTCSTGYATC